MNVLITGANLPLGRVLATALATDHQVTGLDFQAATGLPTVVAGDVQDTEAMNAACSGMDAVVHLARAPQDDRAAAVVNDARTLDVALKGTYAIMAAAAAAGCRRVVQISDLCVYSGYAANLIVQEDFVPLPDTSAWQQAAYLSELIGREFARQYPGLVLTLRLGTVVDAATLDRDARFAWDWVDQRDVVGAVARGLELDSFDGFAHWGLYDLAAPVPGSRYDIRKLTSGRFGFAPQESFAAWRQGGER